MFVYKPPHRLRSRPGIDFLTGIIVSILVSNLVASRVLSDGVYESELERDGNVYYLRPVGGVDGMGWGGLGQRVG